MNIRQEADLIFVCRYSDNQPTVFHINTEILFRLVAFAVSLRDCNAMP